MPKRSFEVLQRHGAFEQRGEAGVVNTSFDIPISGYVSNNISN